MDTRQILGAHAEAAAVWFLRRHGVVVEARNVAVGGGEVDLVGRHGRDRVVVEVRSATGTIRIDDRFDPGKQRTVRRLASALGIRRIDVVGVGLEPSGVTFHWSRDVSVS